MVDYIAQMVLWFDNVVISLSDKGVFDEGDLSDIEDTKEGLGQFLEDAHRDFLLHQADEGKSQ